MTATTRFYTGFFIVLALVVAIAFYVGYRTGESAGFHDRDGAVTHRKAVITAP